jgi:hypothetical protein
MDSNRRLCNDCTDLALDGGVYSVAVFEMAFPHDHAIIAIVCLHYRPQ